MNTQSFQHVAARSVPGARVPFALLSAGLLATVAALTLASPAQAASIVRNFVSGAATDSWSLTANWSSSNVPDTTSEVAQFAVATTGFTATNNFGSRTVGQVRVGSVTTQAADRSIYSSNSSTLTLDPSAEIDLSGVGLDMSIAGRNLFFRDSTFVGGSASKTNWTVKLGSSQQWNITSTSATFGNLTFESGVTLDLDGKALTFDVGSLRTATINGAIIGGAGSISKSSAGLLILGGNNTFTGGVTVGGGEIRLGNAGALNSTTPNLVTFTANANAKTLTLNGNSVSVAGLDAATLGGGSATVRNQNASGATLTTNVVGANSYAFAGTLVNGTGGGALSLVKSGTGTQTLSGANTYTGGTIISAGILRVNNTTGSGTGSGDVIVNGGKLQGTGSFTGDLLVNAGGTVAPGNSIESLGTGSISFDGGTFDYELNTTLLQADLLYGDDGSTLTLINSPILNLIDLGSNSFVPAGNKFTLIAYDGTWNGGIFSGYPDDSLFGFAGNSWRINYNDTSPGMNFNGDATAFGTLFVTITSVPEPSAYVLGLLGLAGLGLVAWSRTRRMAVRRNP